MECREPLGVRNLKISFKDCYGENPTGEEKLNVSHILSDSQGDIQANLSTVSLTRVSDSANFIKMSRQIPNIALSVVPDPMIPISWYTGAASINMVVEFFNGRTVVGTGGFIEGGSSWSETSVSMTILFKSVSEMKAKKDE